MNRYGPTDTPVAPAQPHDGGGARFPIAYLAGTFPLRSETFVYREIRALRDRGWPVTVVSLNTSPDAAGAEMADVTSGVMSVYGANLSATLGAALLEVARHPLRSGATLLRGLRDALLPGEPTPARARILAPAQALAAVGVAHRLRPFKPRHLHCHFAHAPASVGMYAARQLGIPWSFTGHANDLFQRRALLKRKLEEAAFVSCISEWHRDFYRQHHPNGQAPPAGGAHYRIIRCGVDVAQWAPAAREAKPDTAADGTLHIMTLCRLVEKKGVDTLLRACALLTQRGLGWRLTIAGDGPDRARLEQLARELGCADHIRWLGAVENPQVPALLKQADVFALPCRVDARGDRDGIPVVFMEAMACGVPVVSGDLPAVRELIRDGDSGMIVDGNDPAALAECVAKLSADAGLRQRLSDGGRRRVEEEFSLAGNVARLEQAFRDAQGGTTDRS